MLLCVILIHLDCSAELMLKERLISQDKNIFEKSKSISLRKCVERIGKEPSLLHKNEFIILHDMRNGTQHLGILPDKTQAKEIIDKVLFSIHSFLGTKFDKELESLNNYLERIGERKEISFSYLKVAEEAYNSGDLESAFLIKFEVLELLIKRLGGKKGLPLRHALTGGPIELSKLAFGMIGKSPITGMVHAEIEKLTSVRSLLLHNQMNSEDLDLLNNYKLLSNITNSIKEELEKTCNE